MNIRVAGLLFVTLFCLLLSNPLFSNDSDRPTISHVSQKDIEYIKTHPAEGASMQISFPVFMPDRVKKVIDVFAYVWGRIPERFAHLKLNTIGRMPHFTLLYLDKLTMSDLVYLLQAFHRAGLEGLRKYDLLREYRILDPNPENVRIKKMGTKSPFLAYIPDSDAHMLLRNLYGFLKEYAPRILEIHLKHGNLGEKLLQAADSAHISLVQGGEGIPWSRAQIARDTKALEALFRRGIRLYKKHNNGEDPVVTFSLLRDAFKITMPPRAFVFRGFELASIGVDPVQNKLAMSNVVRWRYPIQNGDIQETRELEFHLRDILEGKLKASLAKPFPDWKDPPRVYPETPRDQFKGKLNHRLVDLYEQAISKSSPMLRPAHISVDERDVFFSRLPHSGLAPEKARHFLDLIKKLNISHTKDLFVGPAIYASYVRKEVKNPGDIDCLFNILVNIPDNVKTYNRARAEAVRLFDLQVMGHYIRLMKQGKIGMLEMRIGSSATMGHGNGDVADFKDNPYLSARHVRDGLFVDQRGKTWTLRQLLSLGDFVKGKIDVFIHDTSGKVVSREELSLQFIVAFNWRGNVYSLHNQSFKGLMPLPHTAVYTSPDSYAIASIMRLPHLYYAVQKGPLLPNVIGELYDTAFKEGDKQIIWTAKLLKKFYNYLILLNQSEGNLDEIFYKEVIRQREFTPSERRQLMQESWLGGFVQRLLRVVNFMDIGRLNVIRRMMDDLDEFSERRHDFEGPQLSLRLDEFVSGKRALVEILQKNGIELAVKTEVVEAFDGFGVLYRRLKHAANSKAANDILHATEAYEITRRFVHALMELEGQILTRSEAGKKGMSSLDMKFITAFLRFGPAIYQNYLRERGEFRGRNRDHVLRLMGKRSHPRLGPRASAADCGIIEMILDSVGKSL